MKLYKLTTQDGRTRVGYDNETQWGENVTHSGTGQGELCGSGYIHAYTDPLLAVLLNPIHADINNPALWECDGEVAKTDKGLKVGCVKLTTIRRIDLPVVTMEQRVKFSIYCALEVYSDPSFVKWANDWLSNKDRSRAAAKAAAAAAATAWAAAKAAAAAAWAAAAAAAATAWVAARAAETAAGKNIDLISIAKRAVA